MAAESLQAACELAYVVARDDAESGHLAEPPASMRSFLFVSDLPRRAITVAQQAIEDDSDFRARVAARATEASVGRAGYLWLRRPPGWASEFDELTMEPDDATFDAAVSTPEPDPELEQVYQGLTAGQTDLQPVVAVPDLRPVGPDPGVQNPGLGFSTGGFSTDPAPIADAPMASVSPITGSEDPVIVPPSPTFEPTPFGSAAVPERAEYEEVDTGFTPLRDAGADMLESTEMDLEADALESELSSLRGLVDRLAGERETVVSNSPGIPAFDDRADTSGFDRPRDGELMALERNLEAARQELTTVKRDLNAVRQEREEAQRLQSDALKRQVDMERELASVREAKQEVENGAAESQALVISLEDRLSRITAQLDDAVRERNVLTSQLETMTVERNHIREDRAMLKAERDDLSTKVADIEEKSGGVDIGELVSSNRTLTSELDTTSRELARMIAQAESFEEQIKTSTSTADSLKTEKIQLTATLKDAQIELDAIRSEYEVVSNERDRLTSEGEIVRNERDDLRSQLTELQASLADVLAEQSESRQRNDADRKALNELRVERDVQMARMADLEQADRDAGVKAKALAKERDDLIVQRDDLIAERGQMRAEMSSYLTDRDTLADQHAALQAKVGPLETELQAERRQREELGTRLLEMDEVADQNKSEILSLTEERDRLAATVDELEKARSDVNELRIERDSLAARLDESDRRAGGDGTKLAGLSEQLDSSETERKQLERQLSDATEELDAVRAERDELNHEVARLAAMGDVAGAAGTNAGVASVAEQTDTEAPASPGPTPVDPGGDISQAVPVVEFPQDAASSAPDWTAETVDISAAAGIAPGSAPSTADDLDEVGDLVSQTVSRFPADPGTPSVLPDLGMDLTAPELQANGVGDLDPIPSIMGELGDDITQAIPQVDPSSAGFVGAEAGADGLVGTAAAGSRRRQIEIPGDILDDEIAVAQFVVSSPDVVLLVDGDSVAKLGWPSLLVAEQRDALVTYLADLSASSGAAPDVVFDGRIGDDESLPASRAVRIRLSTPPTEPAAALDELVDAYPDQWPIALVTDDQELASSARGRGAAVLNNGQLLDLFIAQ